MKRLLLAAYVLGAIALWVVAISAVGLRDTAGAHDGVLLALAAAGSVAALASAAAVRRVQPVAVTLYLVHVVCYSLAIAFSSWASGIRVAPPVVVAFAIFEVFAAGAVLD